MADQDLVRLYHAFLDPDHGEGQYMKKIGALTRDGEKRMLVNLNHIRAYNAELAKGVVEEPKDHVPAFEKALNDLVLETDPDRTDDEPVHLGFTGQFGTHIVSPRSLTARYLTHMVCLEGIVTKCSLVRPKMVRSVHYCPATNKFTSRDYRDATDWGTNGPTGTRYPTKDEEGNPLQMEFGRSTYKANQMVTIQEMPERAPLGQLPRSVDVLLNHDLVDACKPGDRVQIVGVYRALAGQSGSTSGMFRTLVMANSVRLLSKDIQGMKLTREDITNIRSIASQKTGSESAFELMARSLAPSIYGHEYLKKAILLMLLGGREVVLENGTHLRGDINILMVGDPSTAKSQMLRFVLNIAPLAVNTTGRGSSGVGLTAAVTTDSETKERRLEAGAMVLADRGVVCIDEFDKMSDMDRVAIHEVMEQQTVTIAKASIHATLNARCSVIAAANPVYGSYDKTATPQRNVGLPDSLLSRFDLLFIVLDEMDRKRDTAIANHVLRMHRYERPGNEGRPVALDDMGDVNAHNDDDGKDEDTPAKVFEDFNPLLHAGVAEAMGLNDDTRSRRSRRSRRAASRPKLLTMEFIKKFVHYAKMRVKPVLTDDARELIATEYNTLRQKQDVKTMPITARCLETIIRISTAHAKTRLSSTVTVQDVEAAVAVLKYAMYHEAEPIKKSKKRDRDSDDDDGEEQEDDRSASRSASRSRSRSSPRATPRKTRRRSMSSSPRKSESDSDVDMAGAGAVDGADVGAASPSSTRRSSRSSTRASTRASSSASASAAVAPASPARRTRAAAATAAATPGKDVAMGAGGEDAASVVTDAASEDMSMSQVDLPEVDTKSKRFQRFRAMVAKMFKMARGEPLMEAAVLSAANARDTDASFTLLEVQAMLHALQADNRVMRTGRDTWHQV